jgi:hypothetical protein
MTVAPTLVLFVVSVAGVAGTWVIGGGGLVIAALAAAGFVLVRNRRTTSSCATAAAEPVPVELTALLAAIL